MVDLAGGRDELGTPAGPSRRIEWQEALARMLHPERFSEPIPSHQALKVSSDGQRLEPYQ
jgi:hypothetical protein